MEKEKKYEGEERRKFVRIPFEAVARYKVHKKKKTDCKHGHCSGAVKGKVKHGYQDADTKDISTGGILFTTKEHFPLFTILEMEMDIPSEDGYTTVKILGEIVRTSELKNRKMYDNGISFYRINDSDREAIEEFMEFAPTTDADDAGDEDL